MRFTVHEDIDITVISAENDLQNNRKNVSTV